MLPMWKWLLCAAGMVLVLGLVSGVSGEASAETWTPLDFQPGDVMKYELSFETPQVDAPLDIRYSYDISDAGGGELQYGWTGAVTMPFFGEVTLADSVTAAPENALEKMEEHYDEVMAAAENQMEELVISALPPPITYVAQLAGETVSVADVTVDEAVMEVGETELQTYLLSPEHIAELDEIIADAEYATGSLQVWIAPEIATAVRIVYLENDSSTEIRLVDYETP